MSELDRQNDAIWKAIDQIAADREITASRLAILSGHDSTSFNKSKRIVRGKKRWPSVEAIAKVLTSFEMTYAEFGALVDKKMRRKDSRKR